jgi:hypothetical protein
MAHGPEPLVWCEIVWEVDPGLHILVGPVALVRLVQCSAEQAAGERAPGDDAQPEVPGGTRGTK